MGRATAYLLADEGASVAVIDRNEPAAREVADAITAAGGSAVAWGLDVSDAGAVRAVVDEVVAHFGSLRIVINNAGISALAPIGDDEHYPAAWERNLAVNLTGELNVAGRIVNIASTEGLGATAMNSPYVAAKHGVVGLTRALAVELGREGITVNCICPGPIHTGMTAGIPDEAKTKFARRRVPMRRYGEPEEVAQITLSLVLPAASFLTGAVIPVDGGLVVQNT
jgi:3-oxoacyl-[acyl-carrier protein] reductase